MESLYGMSYLKNGNVALQVLHRYQEDVRKEISTGQLAAPLRLTGQCFWLKRLAEMVDGLKYRHLTDLPAHGDL